MTDRPIDALADSAEPVEPQPVTPSVPPKPERFPEQPWIPVHPAYLWFDSSERVMAGALFGIVLTVVLALSVESVVLRWLALTPDSWLTGLLWWFIALFLFLAPPAAGAGWYALDRIGTSLPAAVLGVSLGASLLFWLRVLADLQGRHASVWAALFHLTVPYLLWWLARRIALDHAVEPAVVGRKVWDEPRRSIAYGLGAVLRVPTARLLHGVAAPVPNRVRSGRGTFAHARAVHDPVVADAAVVAGRRVAIVWLVRTEPGDLEVDAYGHLFPSVHGIPRGRVSAADTLPYFARSLPGAHVRAFVGLYASGGRDLHLRAPEDSAVRYDTAEHIAGHIATWLSEGGEETSTIDREVLADGLSLWSTYPTQAAAAVTDGDAELPSAPTNPRRSVRQAATRPDRPAPEAAPTSGAGG
ncbi:MAG TPA: hypothetical protein VGD72_12465 [Mycobacteriales bacterium]|jgi:hypothetical protein